MSDAPTPFAAEPPVADPLALWEQRHAELGAWRSGGDRGLSTEENYEFYVVRLGKLLELIRSDVTRGRGLRILDAGCGRGFFTDGMRRCGHRAVGIDASPTAIAAATAEFGPHFVTTQLHAYRPSALFDVIVSIDVLFHVLDDAVWAASLDAFARYAAVESTLVITDVFPDQRYAPRAHIVHRDRAAYDAHLATHGFRFVRLVPYAFGANPIGFAVYRRQL